MNKDHAQEALVRANRIIDQWEENSLESYEAMEMIAPLLKTITAHVENVLDPAAGSNEAASSEKEEKEEGDEAASEKEKEEMLELEEGDLFSKTEDLKLEDESKSKSKKRKEFAGSNGEIPF